MTLKKWLLLFFITLLSTINTNGQSKVKPKNGEGISTFFQRVHIKTKAEREEFYRINKGKFGKNRQLLVGVAYTIPNSKTSKKSNKKLSGAVFYLISGHGGPDPGAIGRYGNHLLSEDEYAYDIMMRLAKNLEDNGAKVYRIIQDKYDKIQDVMFIPSDTDETCMGEPIPYSQVLRLKQRTDKVNHLYRTKDKDAKYKTCIVLHVDSRSKSKRLDVFFYHHKNSSKGKQLAHTLSSTIREEYRKHQPSRGYTGTVRSRGLYVINKTLPPVAFIELGNIQNYQDQKRFIVPDNRQALANWLYNGLVKDFKRNN